MDLGKLEVVKMEMDERIISILGLSESRWTGKGFFQSDKHRVMFSGTENDREKGVAMICNKIVSQSIIGFNPVSERMLAVLSRDNQ